MYKFGSTIINRNDGSRTLKHFIELNWLINQIKLINDAMHCYLPGVRTQCFPLPSWTVPRETSTPQNCRTRGIHTGPQCSLWRASGPPFWKSSDPGLVHRMGLSFGVPRRLRWLSVFGSSLSCSFSPHTPKAAGLAEYACVFFWLFCGDLSDYLCFLMYTYSLL